jgi:mRNA interferase HigB
MHVISKKALVLFGQRPDCSDARAPLEAWYREAKAAEWNDPNDIKSKFRSASILKNSRVVFNIGGNKYRLIVRINYDSRVVFVRFVGTHEEYDSVNAEDI